MVNTGIYGTSSDSYLNVNSLPRLGGPACQISKEKEVNASLRIIRQNNLLLQNRINISDTLWNLLH
jgi:hypothetical protein